MRSFDHSVQHVCGLALMAAVMIVATAAEANAQARHKTGFVAGITRTEQLPTPELRETRKRMVSNKRVSYQQMQVLADRGDGLAALYIAKQLYQKPQFATDALHYFTIAAASGRSGAVKPLVALVRRIQPEPTNQTRLNAAEAALRVHAKRGDEAASDGLMSAYRSGTPFADSPAKYAEFRAGAADRGDAGAALEVAMSLISTGGMTSKRDEIEAYLVVAERSDDLKTQSVAGALRRKLASAAIPETPESGGRNE